MVVRFAPSPTGYLHIGGARTAIFNWLFAKKHNGRFLLRIEDTDQARSTQPAVEAIFHGLQWLGLTWDAPPVFQSKRAAVYQQHIDRLIAEKKAYFCFCTAAELEAARRNAIQEKKQYTYNRACLRLSEAEVTARLQRNQERVVRFHVPDGKKLIMHDLLHGDSEIDSSLIGDFIIQRSDGSAIYQFAVVVDDHDMGITHVIRGDDHLMNTHKQVLLYKALGWPLPQFVHIPLIHGPDGRRLSKRHGATAVHEYADRGILPEALFNFLALLGWSPGNDREFFFREELIQAFSLEGLSKGSAVFDEKKLEWMNAKYIAQTSEARLLELLSEQIIASGLCGRDRLERDKDFFYAIIRLLKPRARYLVDFLDPLSYFLADPQVYDQAGMQKHWPDTTVNAWIESLIVELEKLQSWDESSIERTLRQQAENLGISAARLIHPCRLALTGRTATPGLFEIMAILGKETVLRRLQKASHVLPLQ